MVVPSRLAGVVSGLFLYGCLSARSYQPRIEQPAEPQLFIVREKHIEYVETDKSAPLAYRLCAITFMDAYNEALKTVDDLDRASKVRCKEDWETTQSRIATIEAKVANADGCSKLVGQEITTLLEQAIITARLGEATTSSVTCAAPLPQIAENVLHYDKTGEYSH